MQDGSARRSSQSGWHGDDPSSQGRTAGSRVEGSGERAGRAQQVVGDRRAQRPGGVGAEVPGGQLRQRSVDQVGEYRSSPRPGPSVVSWPTSP